MHIPGHFLEKTSTRILAIALGIIALFLVFLFAIIFPVVQDALFDSRKMAAKNLVDSVCSMLKDYSARVERGDIGSFEARNEAMERIRTMRFEDHGYIWINDTTSPYPVMIMHPVKPSLEGKIMDDDFYRTAVAVQPGMDAREVRFENEKRHFFKVFLEVAENHGKGFVEYQWYRPTASGMTERIYPKKSYVKLFEPWGWIIGTGIYIEDVYAEMNRLKWTIISMAAAIFLLALAGTMFLMRTITEPINQLVWFAEKVAGGSLNARIRGRFRGEMGQLKQAISRMVDELRSRMREAEQRAREAEAAHRALKNSEEKYRQIFENAPLGVVHFDKNGVITACNDTFVEGIGSSRQDLVGMDMLGLPDEKIVQAVNAALGGRLGFYEGVYHSVTGGKSTPVRALFAPFRDSRGDIAGGVGMVEDITERKKAEDALRESEEKYCILVENAKEAIFVAQDGMLRFANRAACELTGHGYEMLTSVPFADLLHPEDREFVLDRHYKRLKGNETESDYCFRVVNSSGDLRWVDLSSVEIQWEGRPATLNFVSDITDQKRAEQEREKLEKQLRQSQKIEALGTLTGGVAHDFNNILSIIMGYTELVRSELDENHPAQKGLAEISSAGARARDVVRQLLAFSRRGEEDKSAQNIGLII
ncbi:MAG: PAS domain S-box protein, partial [Desulfosalsimonas sp.]